MLNENIGKNIYISKDEIIKKLGRVEVDIINFIYFDSNDENINKKEAELKNKLYELKNISEENESVFNLFEKEHINTHIAKYEDWIELLLRDKKKN